MHFSSKTIRCFCCLKAPHIKNFSVGVINPYETDEVKEVVKKFYNDENARLFFIGINPRRGGGGLTGIAFTEPVALREQCNVENCLSYRKELSSK